MVVLSEEENDADDDEDGAGDQHSEGAAADGATHAVKNAEGAEEHFVMVVFLLLLQACMCV